MTNASVGAPGLLACRGDNQVTGGEASMPCTRRFRVRVRVRVRAGVGAGARWRACTRQPPVSYYYYYYCYYYCYHYYLHEAAGELLLCAQCRVDRAALERLHRHLEALAPARDGLGLRLLPLALVALAALAVRLGLALLGRRVSEGEQVDRLLEDGAADDRVDEGLALALLRLRHLGIGGGLRLGRRLAAPLATAAAALLLAFTLLLPRHGQLACRGLTVAGRRLGRSGCNPRSVAHALHPRSFGRRGGDRRPLHRRHRLGRCGRRGHVEGQRQRDERRRGERGRLCGEHAARRQVLEGRQEAKAATFQRRFVPVPFGLAVPHEDARAERASSQPVTPPSPPVFIVNIPHARASPPRQASTSPTRGHAPIHTSMDAPYLGPDAQRASSPRRVPAAPLGAGPRNI
eukprot:scaffold16556_cov63-Phaeocystis_antarctica.AAC.2